MVGSMHLLFVSSLLPDRQPATGFEIANRAIVDAYHAAGARVTLAGFRRPGAPRPAEPHVELGELEIENAAVGKARKALWLAEALRTRLPVGAAKLRVMGEAALLARLREAGRVNAVVLSSVQMPIAYPRLPELAPPILVTHNVEHVSAAEMALHAGSALARRLYAREARLLKGEEARLCAEARVVHSLAPDDARRLGLAGDPRSIPLSLTVGRSVSMEAREKRRYDVVLIGTWSWAPNRAGLDWFVTRVAPLLDPSLSVAIAGRFDGPAPKAPANVAFLGRVPDAQAFLRSGAVVALATRGGTGVQLKTIEALEEGMPIVATPSALRGIGAALPLNVRVGDDPQGFAAGLNELAGRERAGESLRLDGRAFAARQRAGLLEGVRAGLARLEGGAGRTEAANGISAWACAS